jgi:hypothetical protein
VTRDKAQQEADREASLHGNILDELEQSCSSYSLDDEEDCRTVAKILTERLIRRGVKIT